MNKSLVLFVLACVISLFVLLPKANAEDVTGNGLLISPTKTEITANPGETKTITIGLKNVTKVDLSAKVYLNDFESDGKTGNPVLITEVNKHTPYSLSGMIQGLNDVQLKAGEIKTVTLTIKLKDSLAPGAYFGVVRYAAKNGSNSEGQDQVALNASVGHLVFITIPGEVNEKIQLSDLQVSNKKEETGILFGKPTNAMVSVKNLGNGFAKPFGKIIITQGSKEITSVDVNSSGDSKSMVLPNSNRTFDNEIKGIKRPGKYKAIASMAYSDGSETINISKTFWYLPVWFIIAVMATVLLITSSAYLIYRKLSRQGSRKSHKKRRRR